MHPLNNIKTIFFDYDGTIHNSIIIYAPAFRKAYHYLVEKGYAQKRNWTNEEISYWLGFNPLEMWNTFMPNLEEDLRLKCSNIIAEEMKHQMIQGKPQLYEGAIEILSYLKNKGYHLVFISNCKTYYKDSHRNLFVLDRYFETMVCSEQFDFIPKHKILKKIMSDYPREMVIIGDRIQDMDAGIKNNIHTIGCNYGFALSDELSKADMIINHMKELKNYL